MKRRPSTLRKEQEKRKSNSNIIELRRLVSDNGGKLSNRDPRSVLCCHKNERIKIAAIYDDQEEVMKIVEGEKNKNAVQTLLSTKDRRGQPCVFYALESRSTNTLCYLMTKIQDEKCLIAENGESVLHVATKIGDVDILLSLLQMPLAKKVVDHVENEYGRTPLHLAATYNHVDVAKQLLLHGASFDREDTNGKTPIFMAASNGHSCMLEVFLNHGGTDLESLILDPGHKFYGRHYENLLEVAVDSGDVKTMDLCLKQDPTIIRKCLREEIKDAKSRFVHIVCQNGMVNCFLRMFEEMEGSERVHLNRKDREGFTPIHKAAINNHHELVKMIGSISSLFVNQPNLYSQTALLLAVRAGHIKVVEVLLDLKADFKICDQGGRTVLHHAISNPDILQMLLKNEDLRQLLINKKEIDGFAPLHQAASKGFYKSFKMLLENGANINVFTATGRSTLHCAVVSQSPDLTHLVLLNEPALINKADSTGKTPLHTAASHGNIDVVKCLLDGGALIVRDNNICSPLHNASHKGHVDVVEMLLAADKKIINWRNKFGRTALVEAAGSGKSNIVCYLLTKGASVQEDHEFFNCLDWCLINNDQETAMAIMKNYRWREVLESSKHGSEGTMTKLVYKMPEVARQALCNSMTSQGHPDSKEHVKRYDFVCLQNTSTNQRNNYLKPMTAVKTMIQTKCYTCLTHPVCCKFLKAKWMMFGWRVNLIAFLMYLAFLISLNTYAFGIPPYQTTEGAEASISVEMSMVVCLVFIGINSIKEIYQLIFYRARYFLDTINFLELVLYVFAFIFAVPVDGKVAVKTSFQWQACSVAVFLAWINLVLFLRRFASYGIIVLMMKKISLTLMQVLSLLIFFFVAFAAAFSPIMNDVKGFENVGFSMITSAIMTLGELDFKETFLDDTSKNYETFFWIRIVLLVVFLILMPIILMNLLLALAIDDTSKIREQAELRKHVQTAEMIIELERKHRPFLSHPKLLAPLEERPNKRVNFFKNLWTYIFYGREYRQNCQSNEELTREAVGTVDKNVATMLGMMKELQMELSSLKDQVDQIQSGQGQIGDGAGGRPKRVYKSASTQFRGTSVSFEEDERRARRAHWMKDNGRLRKTVSSGSYPVDDEVFRPPQDIQDDRDREMQENDAEFLEIRELHKRTPTEESPNGFDLTDADSNDNGFINERSSLLHINEREEEMDNGTHDRSVTAYESVST